MLSQLNDWFQRNFSDPQVVILALSLILGLVLVLMFGRILTPVFASLIIAYLLEGAVQRLERFGLPRLISVITVFSAFMTALFFLLFGLLPMVTRQLTAIVAELPRYIRTAQDWLATLPERYPQLVSSASDTALIEPDSTMVEEGENLALISQEQLSQMLDNVGFELGRYGTQLVSFSGVVGIASLLVFLVIMPVLVFFFLKDKSRLIAWFASYLPRNRGLVSTVWKEVDVQIANYVRGKALEILIVWIVTYVVFSLLNMPFTMLLSMVVGFSVIIPYIGAAVVTIPVALVALIAFGGLTAGFWSVIIAYAIIQALDGNVLVPILFSEVVDLHPVAIITAILVFGGLWGFWGVFFAIPLATLVNAVLRAWPRVRSDADLGSRAAVAD